MGVIHNKAAIEELKKTAASLQEQINNIDPGGGLTVTVTDVTEDLTNIPEGVTATAYLETYGNICHFSLSVTIADASSAIPDDTEFYTIPETLVAHSITAYWTAYTYVHPYQDAQAYGYNGAIYGGMAVENDGDTTGIDVYWIANPAPAPEPGE